MVAQHCVTVLLCYCVIVLLCYCATVLLCYCATVLLLLCHEPRPFTGGGERSGQGVCNNHVNVIRYIL